MPLGLPKIMSRKRRSGLYIAVVSVGLLALAVPCTYFVAHLMVTDALINMQVEAGEVEVVQISLYPPFIDIRISIVLKNPSSIDLKINNLRADVSISCSGKDYQVAGVNVEDEPLPSRGRSVIPLDIRISYEITREALGGDCVMSLSGKISVSGNYFLWTITKEKTVDVSTQFASK